MLCALASRRVRPCRGAFPRLLYRVNGLERSDRAGDFLLRPSSGVLRTVGRSLPGPMEKAPGSRPCSRLRPTGRRLGRADPAVGPVPRAGLTTVGPDHLADPAPVADP